MAALVLVPALVRINEKIMNKNHPNAELLKRFYQAFQKLDAEIMAQCYAPNIRFSDPVFTDLRGSEAGDMWRMLCSKASDFSLTFDVLAADDQLGKAQWVATYTFSQTGRKIVNHIQAEFEFENGKIVRHTDRFDLWKWTRQALGLKGLLLGWSGIVQNKVRAQAARGLRSFSQSRH